jgi:hypothetical protein
MPTETATPTTLQPDTRRLLNCPCLICDTKLTDPTSVTLGIGPTCRKNIDWNGEVEALSPGDNARAKALVYEAALKRDSDPERVLAISVELLAMGLTKLATRIQDRFIEVRLHLTEEHFYRWVRDPKKSGGGYEVKTDEVIKVIQVRTPYAPGFRDALYQAGITYKRPVYVTTEENGRTKREFSHWEVKYAEARALYKALSRLFPGKAAIGPKGIFKVPTADEFDSKYSRPNVH